MISSPPSVPKPVTAMLLLVGTLALSACNLNILKDNGRRAAAAIEGTTSVKPAVDYEMVRTRVITPRCDECHSAGSPEGDLSTYAELRRRIVPGDAQASVLFRRLKANGGDMPDNSDNLTAEEVEILRSWITNGAPENATASSEPTPVPSATPEPTPEPTPTPEPSATPSPNSSPTPTPSATPEPSPTPVASTDLTKFDGIYAQVIAPKCLMCHDAPRPRGDILLNSYDEIVTNVLVTVPGRSAESGLYLAIRDASMPPPRAVQSGRVQAVTPDEIEAIKVWIDAGAPR